MYTDTKIYALYRSHLSKGLIDYATNEALGEIKRVGSSALLPGLLGILLLVTLFYFFYKFSLTKLSASFFSKIKYVYISAFLVFLFTQFTYMYVDVINYIPIKKWTRHIPFYQPLTARRAMFKYGLVDPSKVRDFEIKSSDNDSSINYPKELNCSKPPKVKPNIMWFFIDSWRFEQFDKETTPNLYEFVKNNPTDDFINHWGVGNETIPNMFAMFYGVPGLYIKSFTESGKTPLFLSKMLSEDYEFQISTGWPLDATSLTKNVFREVPSLRVSNLGKEAHAVDKYIETEVSDFLDKRDPNKPHFSFMIFDSAHDYSLPKDYKNPFKPFADKMNYFELSNNTDPTPYLNRYKNAVHYIDSIIGKIISLEKINDPKRPTIIVISSDHGEELNDLKKNFWGHSSNFARFQLRVPLSIYWDDFKPLKKKEHKDSGTTYNHMTTHNDLAHTFLESVFGCEPSKTQSVGNNLYDTTKRLPLLISTYSRHGVLTEDRIYSYEIGQGYEVFDYDYNEIEVDEIPKSIFQQYLKESSRFYN